MSSSSSSVVAAGDDSTSILDAKGREKLGMAPSVVLEVAKGDELSACLKSRYPSLFAQGVITQCDLKVSDATVLNTANGQTLVVIERKTLPDLAASRNDGRWRSQRERMTATGAVIVYAIQAEWADLYGTDKHPDSAMYGNVTNSVLHGMLRNAVCFDRHTVVFTGRNIESMADWLVTYVWRTWASAATVKPPKRPSSKMEHALAAVSAKKAANMTPSVYHVSTLATIPGVGEARAQVVAAEYNTPHRLIEALRSDGIEALTDLPGIGRVLAAQIYEYMLHKKLPQKSQKRKQTAAAAAPAVVSSSSSSSAAAASSAPTVVIDNDNDADLQILLLGAAKRRRSAATATTDANNGT